MKPTPEDLDREDPRRSKPPLFVRMADEGNVPGRTSPKVLAFLVVVLLVGLAAVYFAR